MRLYYITGRHCNVMWFSVEMIFVTKQMVTPNVGVQNHDTQHTHTDL